MIAIVDYGMGNVASVSTAFKRLGYETAITDDKQMLHNATHIVLPGVGSFHAAMAEIGGRDLKKTLQKLSETKPFLGICLGMQLLFTEGFEGGFSHGLDILPGSVERMETDYILPHIGWNALAIRGETNPFKRFENEHVYFVHTFAANTEDKFIAATADYGVSVPAIVKKDNIYGIQFHPEKSGEVGIQILKTFLQEEL
ncbi:imidazole glycerol phosphate synthase subunit HisH [Sediminibacillus albus]|uniref:Imidazole glycerol phosphate synthase subunit HisH n=1 Tax=Sediminibacillus albus TaxID=407036 RepID=A0A1G8VW76_9BACI|nr:imidazole glycerol phosphate synthase subunit HisH [Sediminibacillus albus]SDJ69745.1 glutamine amidotransferase [Sediminibacillus albus]